MNVGYYIISQKKFVSDLFRIRRQHLCRRIGALNERPENMTQKPTDGEIPMEYPFIAIISRVYSEPE